MSDSFVADSEPEREEERKRLKDERRQQRLADSGRKQLSETLVVSPEPTERSAMFIEILDSDDSPVAGPSKPRQIALSSPREAHRQAASQSSNTSETEEEDQAPKLLLQNFAFQPVSRTGSRASSTCSDLPVRSVLDQPRKRTKTLHTLADISDRDFALLTKCVSCDVKWTIRKSAVQKSVHIRTCSKKNGLTEDTVKLLIRKEITSSKAQGKRKTDDIEDVPKADTLLGDVVKESGPSKRRKRPNVQPSVRPVDQIREDILDRAKSLLGRQVLTATSIANAVDDSASSSSKPPLDNNHGNNNFGPPLTQAFTTSRLTTSLLTKKSMFDQYDDEAEAVETSQIDVPLVGGSLELPSAQQSPSVQVSTNTPLHEPIPDPPDTSLNTGDGLEPFYNDIGFNNTDNAILHFEPGGLSHNRMPASVLSPSQAINCAERPVTAKKARSTSKKKGRTKKTAEDASKTISEEELHQKFQDMILNDSALYLRVLHYEPVHIDEWVTIASKSGIIDSKLKDKLRHYLDTQAVHYSQQDKKRGRR